MLTTMRARDPNEPHRASTPLELLFDLTFVVAVAAVVPELAHAIVDGHPLEGIVGYLLVFFGIWWAWMNFTWFASAFDCDDALYRVLTMVQMAGVLVLAAGVGPAFQDGQFATAVAGYVLMRIALVAQWLRVARSVPEYRETALRFAVPIAAVQLLWIARLALPAAVSDRDLRRAWRSSSCSIPVWAERRHMTPWHPASHRRALRVVHDHRPRRERARRDGRVRRCQDERRGSRSISSSSPSPRSCCCSRCWWLYFLDSDAPRLEAPPRTGVHLGLRALLRVRRACGDRRRDRGDRGGDHPRIAASGSWSATASRSRWRSSWPLDTRCTCRSAASRLARRELIAAEIAIALAIPLTSVVLSPAWVLASLAAAAAGLVAFKSMRFGVVSAGEAADTPRVSGHHQDGRHEGSQVPEGGTTIPSQGHAGRPAD